METIITREYLLSHPDEVFVFGDNLRRVGSGGAAILRDMPNVYGFVTKRAPTYYDGDFYRPDDYRQVYETEISLLKLEITSNPGRVYLISRLGGGLANRFGIWESVIEPRLKQDLAGFKNVRFLWT